MWRLARPLVDSCKCLSLTVVGRYTNWSSLMRCTTFCRQFPKHFRLCFFSHNAVKVHLVLGNYRPSDKNQKVRIALSSIQNEYSALKRRIFQHPFTINTIYIRNGTLLVPYCNFFIAVIILFIVSVVEIVQNTLKFHT